LGAMSYAIAGTDALRVVGGMEVPALNQTQQLRERLMPFLLGGLRAPLPEFSADPSGADGASAHKKSRRKTAG
jgi:hypothetical protein